MHDIIQPAYLDEICGEKIQNVDFVYHFAALADLDIASNEPLKTAKINIIGTINALGKKIPKKRKMSAMINAQSLISWPCKTGYNPIITKTAEKISPKPRSVPALILWWLLFSNIFGCMKL